MSDFCEKYHKLDYVPTEEEEAQERAQKAQEMLEILNDTEKLKNASKTLFREADTNHDGSIDRAELREVLNYFTENFELPPISEEALNEELATLDTDSSVTLDISEYSAIAIKLLEKAYQICLS
jgi:Ca2+-binding EF-hand superfamily protein